MNPLRVLVFLHLVAIPAICLSVETSHAFNLTSNATAHMFLPRSVLQDAYYEQVPFPKLPSFVSMVCSGLVQITKSVMWWLFDWVLDRVGLRRWHKCYSGRMTFDINMDDLDHVKSYMAQLDVMHYGRSCEGVNATEIQEATLPDFLRWAKRGESPPQCFSYPYGEGTEIRGLMRWVDCEYFTVDNMTMCMWGTETLDDRWCKPLER